MNLLPDMILLDFCEWLNDTIHDNHNDIDIYDLLLDRNYSSELHKYALLFLQQYKPSLKSIIHDYINSDYFNKSVALCNKYTMNLDSFHGLYSTLCDIGFIHHLFHKGKFDESFYEFIRNSNACEVFYNYNIIDGDDLHNMASELQTSIQFLLNHVNDYSWIRDKSSVLYCMHNLDNDLNVEIDFLEWLIRTKNQPIDIRNMPLKSFEKLVEEFRTDCDKDNYDIKKLIKSFKQKDYVALSTRLLSKLPINTAKRAKDLGYIVDRYQDKNVLYKCVIIPLQADSKEYQELIEKRWEDLHHLSGDYLDIYYAATDYGKSGYEIMKKISCIPDTLKTQAPVIVIWNSDISKAQGVDIYKLDNTDIFDIIRKIVSLIKKQKDLDVIVTEANNMSKELKEQHRVVSKTINNNVVKNIGTIYGNAISQNDGNMTNNIQISEIDKNEIFDEIKQAIRIISNYTDIEISQRERLLEILQDVDNSVHNGSQEDQVRSKTSFNDAIRFLGKTGLNLIETLAGLTSILTFFGYTIS